MPVLATLHLLLQVQYRLAVKQLVVLQVYKPMIMVFSIIILCLGYVAIKKYIFSKKAEPEDHVQQIDIDAKHKKRS
ncbi:hypothetical protein [Amphibacillus sediminis]|uniref:hypothetical protein n=1 Tax=Amphibacillus sediminis TaxID=360185 RepID=UPI000836EBBD|nr:hypothetical protein [Amphibacillus sediminis]